ncbi:MAG: tetratricopeptide repeat protein [Acidobacteria bacterium]|nr:tetratricopeptide repeat protein [Acidobacteriota bacterium]
MKLTNKILAFLAAAMLFAVPSFAQTGNIEGKVTDVDGKPLTGVLISIDRQGIAGHYEVKTDNRGQYLHAGLPTGQYRVAVMRDGKTLAARTDVRVSFGGSFKADFDLKQMQSQGASEEERAKAAEEKAKADATKASFEGARAAMTAKNFDEAVRLFKEAADKDPTQHVIYANLADALSQAKRYDESAAAYGEAIKLKPDEAPYYNNLGIVLGNAGKIDEATQALQKAAELNPPGAGQSYYNLGAVLTNRGRTTEAAAAFKKAIEFNPQMAQAYYQLGISYFGSPATIPDAIGVLEKFLQMAPTDPNAEAAKQLIEAAKQAAPTGFKSEKAIAEEKAAAERAAKQKADAQKAKKKN